MRPRFIRGLQRRLWAAVAPCLLLAGVVQAAPLRVTTWSLEPKAAAQTNGAAEVLKKLDPDVIILQQVENWQSCKDLETALRPTNYSLAVCSAFRDGRTGALSRQQVAILSKAKPYLSWSEAWKSDGGGPVMSGGFAFAALRLNNRNVGFLSVQLGDASSADALGPQSAAQRQGREESARQLLRQIAVLRNWTTNRIQTFVVAGDFNIGPEDAQLADEKTLRLVDEAGLANAYGNAPLSQRITFPGDGQRSDATLDYIFTRNAMPVASPRIIPVAWAEHYPVTCELDLNAQTPAPVVTPVARVEPPPVKTAAAPVVQTNSVPAPAATPVLAQPAVSPANPKPDIWWLAGAGAGGVLLLLLILRLAWRSRVQPANTALPAMKVESGASISLPTDARRIVITHRSANTTGPAAGGQPIIHIETPELSQTQSQAWQRRAEEAERRAHQATAMMRARLLPHLGRWLKNKLVQKLVSDRSRLMETQQAAALKLLAVDDRLAKIESQLQQRNRDYEQRIDELTRELAVAKEENRELIRAKIALVKAEMEKERVRAVAQSPETSGHI